jgi:hypothetical protein
MKWSIMKVKTKNRRYPSLTIHTSNLSFLVNSRPLSSDISPDMSMRVRGGHLDRSRPVRLVVYDMAAVWSECSSDGLLGVDAVTLQTC